MRVRKKWWLGPIVVVLALFGVLSCNRAPEPVGVVLIVVDALRADHLGCYGSERPTSPHIDALAVDGTRFANAVSHSPWTLPSLATLMTSFYPSVHGAVTTSDIWKWLGDREHFQPVNVLDDSRNTLAEVLKANGFSTAAFINGCYPSKVFGFGQGFDQFVDNDPVMKGIRFNIESLLDWLDRVHPQRFFIYLHTAEVHAPYVPLGEEKRYREDSDDPRVRYVAHAIKEERARFSGFNFDPEYRGTFDGSWFGLRWLEKSPRPVPDAEFRHLVALYDRGVAYTDLWVGNLLQGLKQRGLYDRTVLILTADHGDELLDHGGLEHGNTFYEEMMHVPLILRAPGEGHGMVVDSQVGLIDVFPTVLDLVGVRTVVPTQGRSVRTLLSGGSLADRPAFGEASLIPGMTALRTNKWKFIYHANTGAEDLYDLETDRRETVNLCASEKPRCSPFRDQLLQWEVGMREAGAKLGLPRPPEAAVDRETAERLRALGYAR